MSSRHFNYNHNDHLGNAVRMSKHIKTLTLTGIKLEVGSRLWEAFGNIAVIKLQKVLKVVFLKHWNIKRYTLTLYKSWSCYGTIPHCVRSLQPWYLSLDGNTYSSNESTQSWLCNLTKNLTVQTHFSELESGGCIKRRSPSNAMMRERERERFWTV